METYHTNNDTDANSNKYDKNNKNKNSIEKSSKAQTEIGLDSVKSLRERLDKKLKAISQTIDSISKKESLRGLSSNRDRDKLEFDIIEKKSNYNSVDSDSSLPKFNNNNIYTKENHLENSNLQIHSKEKYPNFNSSKENTILDMNEPSYKNNLNKNIVANKYNLNTISISSSYQNNILNLKDKEIELSISRGNSSPKNDKNIKYSKNENPKIKDKEENLQKFLKENPGVKSNILINDNFDLNKINCCSNQNDLNNLNFLNNTETVGIGINLNNYNKNFVIEENFITNDACYKNLINNEISKISHDNFNDEGDPISDNEVENFDFKRKKYNNMAIYDSDEQNKNRNKNFINISKLMINFFNYFILNKIFF